MFAKLLADDFYGKKWKNARAWPDEKIGGGGAICDVTVRDYSLNITCQQTKC